MNADERSIIFAELFSELDKVCDRIEKVLPEMVKAANGQLATSTASLARTAESIQTHIIAIKGQAETSAVNHIIRRTNEVCKDSLGTHDDAMRISATDAFNNILRPQLQPIADQMERLNRLMDGRLRPDWFGYFATALTSSVITAGIIAGWLFVK